MTGPVTLPGVLVGLAVIPALIGAGWLLRQANRWVQLAVAAVVLRVTPGDPKQRARLGASAACARRAYMTEVGGVTFAVLLAHDPAPFPELYQAIRRVIAPVKMPRVRPPGERTPHDPGIDYSDQEA